MNKTPDFGFMDIGPVFICEDDIPIPDRDGRFDLDVNATMYLPAEDRSWECIGENVYFYGAGFESDVTEDVRKTEEECGDSAYGIRRWAQKMANSSSVPVKVNFITTWEKPDGTSQDGEFSYCVFPDLIDYWEEARDIIEERQAIEGPAFF